MAFDGHENSGDQDGGHGGPNQKGVQKFHRLREFLRLGQPLRGGFDQLASGSGKYR